MKQHSVMIVSITKSMQINAQELKECKDKIKMMEKQIESLCVGRGNGTKESGVFG